MQQNIDSYKTIKCTSEGFHKDRGSKFYGYAYPVKSEDELKIKIDVLKKEHHTETFAPLFASSFTTIMLA